MKFPGMNIRGRGATVSRLISIHLAITTIRNLLLGAVLFIFNQDFIGPVYSTAFRAFPAEGIAAILFVAGVLGIVAWLAHSTLTARFSILLADIVFVMLIASYGVALFSGDALTGHWAPILFGSIVAHDFTLVASPFVDPLEDLNHDRRST